MPLDSNRDGRTRVWRLEIVYVRRDNFYIGKSSQFCLVSEGEMMEISENRKKQFQAVSPYARVYPETRGSAHLLHNEFSLAVGVRH